MDIGNVNKFPIMIIVAGQGNGKTVTLAYLFEHLEGKTALFTPKADDHRNPAMDKVYDLKFGYNETTGLGSWFGDQRSFSNSSQMDLDWYLKNEKTGSALDFIGAVCATAENRTARGTKKGRHAWRVFYDEANQVFTGGFTKTEIDGVPQGSQGAKECQYFIEANLKASLFNFRGAGVQMWIGCISETVQNIGLKGCSEALNEAWHLYPGPKAIEIAKKCKQLKLSSFLQRALSDGYAIAILEQGGTQFKVIRMPKLADLSRFDPIIEDESPSAAIPITEHQDVEDLWDDEELIEPAIAESVVTETMDQIAKRIMAMTYLSMDSRLQMIEEAHRG